MLTGARSPLAVLLVIVCAAVLGGPGGAGGALPDTVMTPSTPHGDRPGGQPPGVAPPGGPGGAGDPGGGARAPPPAWSPAAPPPLEARWRGRWRGRVQVRRHEDAVVVPPLPALLDAADGDNISASAATASRTERSANLSHIAGSGRKIMMYVRNRHLQILPDGTVNGTDHEGSDYGESPGRFYWDAIIVETTRSGIYSSGQVTGAG